MKSFASSKEAAVDKVTFLETIGDIKKDIAEKLSERPTMGHFK